MDQITSLCKRWHSRHIFYGLTIRVGVELLQYLKNLTKAGSFGCFLLLFLAADVKSQIKSVLSHYSTNDGLPDDRIRTIIKDNEGFMWFASWAGLSRFDGHNFVNFKSYPGDRSSLRSNRINEIADDKAGFIWLRAYDSQIYRFDKKSQQFLAVADLLKSKATISFSSILYADKHSVWLKSINHGLFLISKTANEKPLVTQFSTGLKAGYNLPGNQIIFLHRASPTKVWLGTSKGLAVLNMQTDGSYRSVEDNRFKGFVCLSAATANNDLWFTTAQGYLIRYSTSKNSLVEFKLSNAALQNVWISKRYNRLFCTTSSGQLISVNRDGTDKKLFQVSSGKPILSIFEDSAGLLWIEPEDLGIYKLDLRTGKSRYFVQPNQSNFLHVPEDYKVFEDKRLRVWTSMKGCGFGCYNREKDEIEYFHNNPSDPDSRFTNSITALYYDRAGVMWLSSDARGLEKIVFPRGDFKQNILNPKSYNIVDNEVRAVLKDRENRLWIATKAGELYISKNGKRLENLLSSMPSGGQGVYCLYEDSKGRIWMGTKDNGLFKATFNEKSGQYDLSHYKNNRSGPKSLNTNTVYTLLEDRKGRIWGGSYENGLILVDESNNSTEFLTRGNSFKNYPKVGYDRVRTLAEAKDGKIWIGTTEGLIVFDPTNGSPDTYKFHVYKKEPGDIKSLGGEDVQFLFRDSRGTMWVCTSSGGVNKAIITANSDKITFENFSSKDGLPSDYVLSCIEDLSGDLWFATQNGLSKLNRKKGRFENFGSYDGLTNVSFSEGPGARLQNGEIVFGARAGYWSFNPAELGKEKVHANLALTRFQINNQDVEPSRLLPWKQSINTTSEVELKHDENTISIDFAVLDYRLGNNDNYLYRLRSFNDKWQVSKGQRRATYTNLAPGKYVFEVRSQTEYLYDKVPYRRLTITILPPPWKTWWAYLIYFLIATGLILIAKKFALTMLRLRQGIAIERRMTDLKLSFFTQVSHELRTPLTLILSPAEEILQSEKLSVKGMEYVDVVIKNARRMVRLVNQLLDLRKAQSGKALLKVSQIELLSFVNGVIQYFQESIKKRNLSVIVNSEFTELLVWVDVEKMDIVIYNLLANAIKFSPDNGSIEISIKKAGDKHFHIEVADAGVGVLDEELDKIFELYYEGANHPERPAKGTGIGLALSKELIDLHKGRIFAVKNSPQGLRVVIELLLNKDHYNPETINLNSLPLLHEIDEVSQVYEAESPLVTSEIVPDRPTVLLVEDNDELRSFLANKLTEYYNVETACDGEEGIRKAKEILPDLVLSDIMMPKVDGIQLLDVLKNDVLTSHIPIILLTAKLSVQAQIEALKYGADYYISKPFPMELLQTVVQSLISQRKKLVQSILAGKKITETSPKSAGLTSHDQKLLEKIIEIVNARLADSDFNIDDVAESIGMSRSSFFKKFKSLTNSVPVEFVRETRLNRAKQLFDAGEKNVSTVAYSVGFNDPKYFSTCFKAQFKQRPSEYIKELADL